MGTDLYLCPVSMVNYTMLKDYSTLPVGQIFGLADDTVGTLPAITKDRTMKMAQSELQLKEKQLHAAMDDIERKEKEMHTEIEAMKAEIERKYQEQFAVLKGKMAELESRKKELEKEIFYLDGQIYALRCFLGETIHFTKLVSGTPAAIDTPVVLYQKLRYLDEELGKIAAIYGFDGNDTGLFEELIQVRPDIRDHFFPGEKSISLIRISKDGKYYVSEDVGHSGKEGSVSFYNVIKQYEVYHGNMVGILIRNGENCYIGWTDPDRIHVAENAFLSPGVKTDAYEGGDIKSESKEVIASRYFVFSILQGAILHEKLLSLPEGESLSRQNSHSVIFSLADGWLKDQRFGSLSDLVKRANEKYQKGDMVILLQYLRAEENRYARYSNDRGIGYANRTHDVSARKGEIYPINKIECNAQSRYESIYISLKKMDEVWDQYGMHEAKGRANFQIYRDEFINLEFVSSLHLTAALMNREVGNYLHGNFSYYLPILNTAISYLKEREQKEEEDIRRYCEVLPNEWQIRLVEWKYRNDIHHMTRFQAKRFAKTLESLA